MEYFEPKRIAIDQSAHFHRDEFFPAIPEGELSTVLPPA
jgi:hypothetical protein